MYVWRNANRRGYKRNMALDHIQRGSIRRRASKCKLKLILQIMCGEELSPTHPFDDKAKDVPLSSIRRMLGQQEQSLMAVQSCDCIRFN